MKKKRQLERLKRVREVQCQRVMEKLALEQSKLQLEEQRLLQLEAYQKTYAWDEGRQASGLSLSSAQMMFVNVEKAVKHQQHQVATQEAHCRTAKEKYLIEKRSLKVADSLVNKRVKILVQKAARSEQKTMDEMSARNTSIW